MISYNYYSLLFICIVLLFVIVEYLIINFYIYMIKIILLLFIDNYKYLYFCKYSFYDICEYYIIL